MELLLCINARLYRYGHTLQKGKVYEKLDEYRCPCGNTLFKVEGATITTPPPKQARLTCRKCKRDIPWAIWGYFWYKRFIPINDPDLKETTTEEQVKDPTFLQEDGVL